jgi:hypothetical protein
MLFQVICSPRGASICLSFNPVVDFDHCPMLARVTHDLSCYPKWLDAVRPAAAVHGQYSKMITATMVHLLMGVRHRDGTDLARMPRDGPL